MAEYPTQEQLRDPEYVWPLEYAAPQDRGESAPAANPAPGPGNPTEPDAGNKEFVDTSANLDDIYASDDSANFKGVDRTGVKGNQVSDVPASKGGGVEVQGAGRKK
jgi:hypothetical protein